MPMPTLTFSDYQDLVDRGIARQLPLTTAQAARVLQGMGFDATEVRLDYYLKRQRLHIGRQGGRNYRWTADDIEIAAAIFDQDGHWGPQAQMNRLLDLDYAERLRAEQVAWVQLTLAYPGRLADLRREQCLVMQVHPPCPPRRGRVTFTPTEEVLAYLGEPMASARAKKPTKGPAGGSRRR
ncbi:MAG: hypothetical protein L6R48_19590 [Planctomycetes bacterium]|nr:hypothetical protein [Planctomycetota bacterium]